MPALTRANVAGFIRDALAAAESAPRQDVLEHLSAPAGIPLCLLSNVPPLFGAYAARLSSAAGAGGSEAWRIHAIVSPPGEPLPAWADDRCAPQTFHRLLAEQGLRAAYPYRPNVWQGLDMERRLGIQLVGDLSDLPPWDSGAPLRQHLHWLLQAHGMRLVHASTLGVDGTGVVFLGSSGAGKSGVVLAGLSRGMQTVGDDYVALTGGGEIAALPLFNIIKQDRAGIARLPQLAAATAALPENWKGKVELDPGRVYPGAFAPRLAIRAVVVPRISGADRPHMIQCAPGEAMRALMKSNLHQFPGEPEDGMRFFGDMLRRLPVYTLELSRDFARNGDAVAALVGRLA